MKMPEKIDASLLAPCGMNCLLCTRFLRAKEPCRGCLFTDENKPEHCRKCFKKDCTAARGITYCVECEEYPCRRMKYMEETYRTRYLMSLDENGRFALRYGPEAFMEREREKRACRKCGGVISIHERACSECGQKV